MSHEERVKEAFTEKSRPRCNDSMATREVELKQTIVSQRDKTVL